MHLRILAAALVLFPFFVGCSSIQKKSPDQQDQLQSLTSRYPVSPNAEPPIPVIQSGSKVKPAPISRLKRTQKYIGLKGYFTRPPLFVSSLRYQNSFQRCVPVEITGVYQEGKGSKGKILVYVKQNGYTFPLLGLNRKDFQRTIKGEVPLLDLFFKRNLESVKSHEERRLAQQSSDAPNKTPSEIPSEVQKLCSGETWKEMSKEQFLFVSGDPESSRIISSQGAAYDVLSYSGSQKESLRHYYFLQNKLASWTL